MIICLPAQIEKFFGPVLGDIINGFIGTIGDTLQRFLDWFFSEDSSLDWLFGSDDDDEEDDDDDDDAAEDDEDEDAEDD